MTARATSETDVANLALALIKQPPIASLDDDNDRARAVKAVLASARDAMLRQKNWNFATGWQTLSQVPSLIYPGPLKNVFKLPEGCLKVRHVKDAGPGSWDVVSYAIDPNNLAAELPVLVANLTTVLLCFTRGIADVRLWDAEFVVAAAHRVAQFAGPQLGLSATRMADIGAKADAWRDEAATTDGQESATRIMSRSTTWTRARLVGGSRGHRP